MRELGLVTVDSQNSHSNPKAFSNPKSKPRLLFQTTWWGSFAIAPDARPG